MLGQRRAFVLLLLVVIDFRSLPFAGIDAVDPAALSVAAEPATLVMLACLFCTTQSSRQPGGGVHIPSHTLGGLYYSDPVGLTSFRILG